MLDVSISRLWSAAGCPEAGGQEQEQDDRRHLEDLEDVEDGDLEDVEDVEEVKDVDAEDVNVEDVDVEEQGVSVVSRGAAVSEI